MSPATAVVPVDEIPVLARIVKLPAVPRYTGAGPAAYASELPEVSNTNAITADAKFFSDAVIK
jgi:hypothetical protein